MRRLFDLSRSVLAETTLDGLLRRVLAAAKEIVGARLGVHGLCHPDGAFSLDATSDAATGDPCPGAGWPEGRDSPCAALFKRQGAVRLNRDELHSGPRPSDGEPEGLRPPDLLGVGLTDGAGAPCGVILLSDKEEGEFTAEDEELLGQLAAMAALGMRHVEARRDAEKRAAEIEAAFASMTEGAVVYGPRGDVQRMNQAALRVLGVTAALLAVEGGERLSDARISAEDGSPRRFEELPVRRALAGETIHDEVYLLKRGDNSSWFSMSAAPLFASSDARSGLRRGAVVTFSDVTARRSLERQREELLRELEVERALFGAVVDNAPQGLLVTDAASRVVMVNPAAERLLDARTPVGTPHEKFPRFLRPDGSSLDSRQLPLVRAALDGETALNVELLYAPDETEATAKTFLCDCAPILDDGGQTMGGVMIFQDIAPLKRAQREQARLREQVEAYARELEAAYGRLQIQSRDLKTRKDAAEAATQAKSAFLTNMSHEIRTPLNGVISALDLLKGGLDRPRRDLLRLARDSADHLLYIVNDILDLSKIESGKFELACAEFDLAETMASAIGGFAAMAASKGLTLRTRLAEGLPERVVGDPGRFKQILANLVGNAIKFTRQGSIEVSARPLEDREAASRRQAMLEFTVTDTGVGVPREKLETIFESFIQADCAAGKEYAGTGLGLAICRKLTEMMGGRIWAESAYGLGSRFQFVLRVNIAEERAGPVAPGLADPAGETRPDRFGNRNGLAPGGPAPSPAEEPASERLPPLIILVVEDNAINRILIVSLLEKLGHRVTATEDGRAALEVLAQTDFDLVLMDVQMPHMSGIEATRLIRSGAAGARNRATPVVALTAYALQGDRERFLASGMTEYLTKPIDMAKLDDLLERLPRRAGERDAA